MVHKFLKVFAVFVVVTIIAVWWHLAGVIKANTPFESNLPYYGADTFTADQYQVREFEVIDQDSQKLTRETFENKIWVTDFFFTTCEGICPIMSSNLSSIQDTFAKDSKVLLLSHTVDPNYDKPSVLKSYAQRHNAIDKKWYFATSKADYLYDLARTSYFIATPKDSSLGEDFVHSQLIALIDPHLHIRGYYDGTNGKDMKKLIRDIRLLQKEYPQTK
jgi:protein SCO1/2